MKKLHFKDFKKTRTKSGLLSSKETTDDELMDIVNSWIQRTNVTLVNIESIYRYELTGISVSEGFIGIRAWFMYEAKTA